MKIKAKIRYVDTYEDKEVSVGEVYDTTDERADLIIKKGYAEKCEEEVKKAKPRKKKD